MSTRKKWDRIEIVYEDGTFIQINRRDFEKVEGIREVLEALNSAQRMKDQLDRLLGGEK